MTTENQKKHVLLIWNEIPEGNKFYLIPEEITPEQFVSLNEANDKFINCTGDDVPGLDFLNTALEQAYLDDDAKEGEWSKYKVELPLKDLYISQVFHSGFML